MATPLLTASAQPLPLSQRACEMYVAVARALSIMWLVIGMVGIVAGVVALTTNVAAPDAHVIPYTVFVGMLGALGVGLHPREMRVRGHDLSDGELGDMAARCATLVFAGLVLLDVMWRIHI